MKQQLLFLMFAFFIGLTSSQGQKSLTHKIMEVYDSDEDSFIEISKEEYTYHTNGQLASATILTHYFETWATGSRVVYTYDGNGNLTESIYSTWTESLNEFTNRKRNVAIYAGNRMTGIVDYDWENGKWIEDEKTEFEYVGANIGTFNSYDWNNGQWINDARGTLSYDSNKLSEFISEEFENGTWTFDDKNIYKRNATTGKIEEIIIQTWKGTDWKNDDKINYAIDTNGNRTSETYSEWDDNNTWKFESKTEYSYDSTALMSNYYHPFNANLHFSELGLEDTPHYNKVLTSLLSGYDDSEWEVGIKTTYYYSDDTMGLNDLSNSNFVTVYPNPMSNSLNIKLKFTSEADAKLFDINGRLVLKQKLQALNSTLNTETLNSGIYILKIQSDHGFAIKRLTKN